MHLVVYSVLVVLVIAITLVGGFVLERERVRVLMELQNDSR